MYQINSHNTVYAAVKNNCDKLYLNYIPTNKCFHSFLKIILTLKIMFDNETKKINSYNDIMILLLTYNLNYQLIKYVSIRGLLVFFKIPQLSFCTRPIKNIVNNYRYYYKYSNYFYIFLKTF